MRQGVRDLGVGELEDEYVWESARDLSVGESEDVYLWEGARDLARRLERYCGVLR